MDKYSKNITELLDTPKLRKVKKLIRKRPIITEIVTAPILQYEEQSSLAMSDEELGDKPNNVNNVTILMTTIATSIPLKRKRIVLTRRRKPFLTDMKNSNNNFSLLNEESKDVEKNDANANSKTFSEIHSTTVSTTTNKIEALERGDKFDKVETDSIKAKLDKENSEIQNEEEEELLKKPATVLRKESKQARRRTFGNKNSNLRVKVSPITDRVITLKNEEEITTPLALNKKESSSPSLLAKRRYKNLGRSKSRRPKSNRRPLTAEGRDKSSSILSRNSDLLSSIIDSTHLEPVQGSSEFTSLPLSFESSSSSLSSSSLLSSSSGDAFQLELNPTQIEPISVFVFKTTATEFYTTILTTTRQRTFTYVVDRVHDDEHLIQSSTTVVRDQLVTLAETLTKFNEHVITVNLATSLDTNILKVKEPEPTKMIQNVDISITNGERTFQNKEELFSSITSSSSSLLGSRRIHQSSGDSNLSIMKGIKAKFLGFINSFQSNFLSSSSPTSSLFSSSRLLEKDGVGIGKNVEQKSSKQQHDNTFIGDEARYNLATRIMSNGVEVIVASDKTKTPHKHSVLRIIPSNLYKPMTLAPSTLKDQMILLMPPTDSKNNLTILISPNNFVTKTCLTTFTYRTTYLQDGTTAIESREKVISNIATEERNYLKISPTITSGVTLTRTPELATGIFHTTYTYLNTIIDGELPLVLSSKHTVTNTITAPDDYISFLQPSDDATPHFDTNTYYSKITMTKTLQDNEIQKVISTSNVLTQVVITELLRPGNGVGGPLDHISSTPVTDIRKSSSFTKTPPLPPSLLLTSSSVLLNKKPSNIVEVSTTNLHRTQYITYTYYDTVADLDGTLHIHTNISISPDLITEKLILYTKMSNNENDNDASQLEQNFIKDKRIESSKPVIFTDLGYTTAKASNSFNIYNPDLISSSNDNSDNSNLINGIIINDKENNNLEQFEYSSSLLDRNNLLNIYATKTYLTTFTYFTTLLKSRDTEISSTIINSHTRIIENVISESIPNYMLDKSLISDLSEILINKKDNKPIVTYVTLLGGHSLEITASNMTKPTTMKINNNNKDSIFNNNNNTVNSSNNNKTNRNSTSINTKLSGLGTDIENHNENGDGLIDENDHNHHSLLLDSEIAESEQHDHYHQNLGINLDDEHQLSESQNNDDDKTINDNNKLSSINKNNIKVKKNKNKIASSSNLNINDGTGGGDFPITNLIDSFNLNRLVALRPVFNAMAGLLQQNFNPSVSDKSPIKGTGHPHLIGSVLQNGPQQNIHPHQHQPFNHHQYEKQNQKQHHQNQNYYNHLSVPQNSYSVDNFHSGSNNSLLSLNTNSFSFNGNTINEEIQKNAVSSTNYQEGIYNSNIYSEQQDYQHSPIYIPVQRVRIEENQNTQLRKGISEDSAEDDDSDHDISNNAKFSDNQVSSSTNRNKWLTDEKMNRNNRIEFLTVGKKTYEIPLLNGGIPISPGEIITTNSDVIIGKPSGTRPRIPLTNKIAPEHDDASKNKDSIPSTTINNHQVPNVIPLLHGVEEEDNRNDLLTTINKQFDALIRPPPPLAPPQQYSPSSVPLQQGYFRYSPPHQAPTQQQFHHSWKYSFSSQFPLPAPHMQPPAQNVIKPTMAIHRQQNAAHQNRFGNNYHHYQYQYSPHHNHYNFNNQHHHQHGVSTNILRNSGINVRPTATTLSGSGPSMLIQNGNVVNEILEIKRIPEVYSADLPPVELDNNNNLYKLNFPTFNDDHKHPVAAHNFRKVITTNKPMLVDIKPSQIANVAIPHSNTASVYIVDNVQEFHKNGQYFDEPLPYAPNENGNDGSNSDEFIIIDKDENGNTNMKLSLNNQIYLKFNNSGQKNKIRKPIIKPILSNQQINLDSHVLNHNVDIHVPPITFKKETDFPHPSTPIRGNIYYPHNYNHYLSNNYHPHQLQHSHNSPQQNSLPPHMSHVNIPYQKDQVQVSLTPQHVSVPNSHLNMEEFNGSSQYSNSNNLIASNGQSFLNISSTNFPNFEYVANKVYDGTGMNEGSISISPTDQGRPILLAPQNEFEFHSENPKQGGFISNNIREKDIYYGGDDDKKLSTATSPYQHDQDHYQQENTQLTILDIIIDNHRDDDYENEEGEVVQESNSLPVLPGQYLTNSIRNPQSKDNYTDLMGNHQSGDEDELLLESEGTMTKGASYVKLPYESVEGSNLTTDTLVSEMEVNSHTTSTPVNPIDSESSSIDISDFHLINNNNLKMKKPNLLQPPSTTTDDLQMNSDYYSVLSPSLINNLRPTLGVNVEKTNNLEQSGGPNGKFNYIPPRGRPFIPLSIDNSGGNRQPSSTSRLPTTMHNHKPIILDAGQRFKKLPSPKAPSKPQSYHSQRIKVSMPIDPTDDEEDSLISLTQTETPFDPKYTTKRKILQNENGSLIVSSSKDEDIGGYIETTTLTSNDISTSTMSKSSSHSDHEKDSLEIFDFKESNNPHNFGVIVNDMKNNNVLLKLETTSMTPGKFNSNANLPSGLFNIPSEVPLNTNVRFSEPSPNIQPPPPPPTPLSPTSLQISYPSLSSSSGVGSFSIKQNKFNQVMGLNPPPLPSSMSPPPVPTTIKKNNYQDTGNPLFGDILTVPKGENIGQPLIPLTEYHYKNNHNLPLPDGPKLIPSSSTTIKFNNKPILTTVNSIATNTIPLNMKPDKYSNSNNDLKTNPSNYTTSMVSASNNNRISTNFHPKETSTLLSTTKILPTSTVQQQPTDLKSDAFEESTTVLVPPHKSIQANVAIRYASIEHSNSNNNNNNKKDKVKISNSTLHNNNISPTPSIKIISTYNDSQKRNTTSYKSNIIKPESEDKNQNSFIIMGSEGPILDETISFINGHATPTYPSSIKAFSHKIRNTNEPPLAAGNGDSKTGGILHTKTNFNIRTVSPVISTKFITNTKTLTVTTTSTTETTIIKNQGVFSTQTQTLTLTKTTTATLVDTSTETQAHTLLHVQQQENNTNNNNDVDNSIFTISSQDDKSDDNSTTLLQDPYPNEINILPAIEINRFKDSSKPKVFSSTVSETTIVGGMILTATSTTIPLLETSIFLVLGDGHGINNQHKYHNFNSVIIMETPENINAISGDIDYKDFLNTDNEYNSKNNQNHHKNIVNHNTNNNNNNIDKDDHDDNNDIPSRDEESLVNNGADGDDQQVNKVLLGGTFIASSRPKNKYEKYDDRISTSLLEGNLTGRGRHECRPDCKASRNELCQRVDRVMRCVCRPGFARMFPDRPCKPTYTYSLTLPLYRIGKEIIEYDEKFTDVTSKEHQELAEITYEALDRMVMQSDFRDIYHGVSLTGLRKAELKGFGIVGNFYLQLSDNSNENRLVDVFKKYLRGNNFSIGGTELYTTRSGIDQLKATDFDECVHHKFHDCSEKAYCFNLHGTYTCSCKEGFTDLSENPIYPGRKCSSEIIGCEKCRYHGTCYIPDDAEQLICECFPWYAGATCQLNLKIFLIGLIITGGILLILLLFCILITCTKQKTTRRNRNNLVNRANDEMQQQQQIRDDNKRKRSSSMQNLMSSINILPTEKNFSKSGSGNMKIENRTIIKDSSSEISHNSDTLPYHASRKNNKNKRNISVGQEDNLNISTGAAMQKRSSISMASAAIAKLERQCSLLVQNDRSLSVMIPRAKYHPIPQNSPTPIVADFIEDARSSTTAAVGNSGNCRIEMKGDSGEARSSTVNGSFDVKPLSYLDAANSAVALKKISSASSRHSKIHHQQHHHPQQCPSHSQSGALVSAGFEVSATVGGRKLSNSFDRCATANGGNGNLTLQQSDNVKDVEYQQPPKKALNLQHPFHGDFKKSESNKELFGENVDNWLDCLQQNELTVSEARSYDETTIQPPTKSLRSVYEKQLSQTNNEGSDISGFDSF